MYRSKYVHIGTNQVGFKVCQFFENDAELNAACGIKDGDMIIEIKSIRLAKRRIDLEEMVYEMKPKDAEA